MCVLRDEGGDYMYVQMIIRTSRMQIFRSG